jgi:hypothetical protein
MNKKRNGSGTEAERREPTSRKVGRGRGGKSRDANWKQHTVLLEKETHLDALDLLRRHYEGQDMSDLLNRLLKEWVKRLCLQEIQNGQIEVTGIEIQISGEGICRQRTASERPL